MREFTREDYEKFRNDYDNYLNKMWYLWYWRISKNSYKHQSKKVRYFGGGMNSVLKN